MNELLASDKEYAKIILAIGIVIAAAIFGFVVRKSLLLIAKAKRYEERKAAGKFMVSIAKSAILLSVALAFFIGKTFFDFTESINLIISTSASVLIVLALGVWFYHIIEISSVWFDSHADKSENATGKMLYPVFKRTFQVIVIAVVAAQIFQIVSNKPLTPILASFGIVGAAVALASQDTFKNFFGSFVLASDKPFSIGDRIVIDGFDGVVESIGIRSTRIKTLDDHLVTFPNGILANKSIQNISKRACIKRVFTVSVTYDTSPEKVRQAVDIIRNILANHEGMNTEFEPRVYFKDLNTFSLDIMVIYWYFPPLFWDYMDFTQKVNFQILEQFNEAGIKFAFPTQSIDLLGQSKKENS